ncbi:MAG: glycosyltransferase family 4 protein [Pseudonocardia sp.]
MTAAVLVNRSYAAQRVTGQQRYAVEITSRLDAGSFTPVTPPGFWASSVLRTWAWVQLALPWRSPGSVLLSLTARAPLWRRRHVLVVHDLFVLTNPEWYSRRYVWTHAPLLRAQLRGAAAVIAVSEPVARQVAPYVRGPVVVAPNAPSEVFVRGGADRSVLERRGLVAGSYLLTVGSRDPRKNLRRLAEAYGRLSTQERRRHPLVVVGGESAIFAGERIEWPEGTILAGYVPDEELCALYGGARTVVFLSYAEGFGLPLVEAAAAGARGLLLSDIPVFRWVCGDAAHYVDPHRTDSVLDGLRAALAAPRRPRVELDRFTWDASARAVRDACLEVASRA